MRSIAFLAALTLAGSAQAATLTITVTGAEPGAEVRAMVFQDPGSYQARRGGPASFAVRPRDGKITASVHDLPPGVYAVAVFQDRNGNEALDVNLFGVPSEPYGFSAPAGIRVPDFAEASFDLPAAGRTVVVPLR